MYLIDTNVISQAAPSRRVASADLLGWMDRNSSRLFLSAMTIAELEDGIAKRARVSGANGARPLQAWLETLLHLYGDRILAFDIAVARVCGRLSDRARARGLSPGLADLVIAATAVRHKLSLLTRNVRHFAPLGVRSFDPFKDLP